MGEWRRASAGKGGRSRGKGGRKISRSVKGLVGLLAALAVWCLVLYLYIHRTSHRRKAEPVPPFDASRTAR